MTSLFTFLVFSYFLLIAEKLLYILFAALGPTLDGTRIAVFLRIRSFFIEFDEHFFSFAFLEGFAIVDFNAGANVFEEFYGSL